MGEQGAQTHEAPSAPVMLDWALRYAQAGLYIMPLHAPVPNGCDCPKGKECPTPGKHPRIPKWEDEASRDEATIRAWWERWPEANIGLAVGRSGLYAVDVDTRSGGGATWNALATSHRADLESCRHVTGGADEAGNCGMHFFFAMPAGDPLRNTAKKIGPGIDTRGAGGMVVLPPSLHQSGRRYETVRGWELWDRKAKMLPMPTVVLDLLARPDPAANGTPGADMGPIPRGRRDSTLLKVAGRLRRSGLGEDEILTTLRAVNQKRCQPPVEDAKLLDLAQRASRYVASAPAVDPRPANAPKNGAKVGYWCPHCWEDTLDQKLPTKWVCAHCKRAVLFPSWWARRNGEAGFEDVGFSQKTLHEINQAVQGAASLDDALVQAMNERLVPEDLKEHLQRAVLAYRESRPVTIDGKRSLEFRPDGIYLVTDTQNGPDARRVIGRPFSVLKRVEIEDVELAVVEMKGGIVTGDHDEIVSRVRKGNQCFAKPMVDDVVSLLIDACPTVVEGYPTFEVVHENGNLFLPAEIYPRDDVQAEVMKALEPHLDDAPDDAGWREWADLFSKLNLYEVAPAAGLAAIAPLAPVLRTRRAMVPHVLHLSKNPGKGKSLIASAVTQNLWSVKFQQADAIAGESGFRLAARMNGAAVPIGIDECQDLKWERYSGVFKQMAESEDGTSRGTKDLGMKNYKVRGSLIMTSNALPGLSQPLLTRFFVVHYDEHRVLNEAFVSGLEARMARLPVAGPALARAALELCGGKEENLLRIVRQEIRPELNRLFKNWVEKGRRPTAWASIYFGWKVWDKASNGVVKCPPIEDFVRDVIAPVEQSTRDAVMDPMTRFISWKLQHQAANQVGDGRIRGDGILFMFAEVKDRRGWWITQALLDKYNHDHRDQPEAMIAGLSELGNLVHDRFQIPLDVLRDNEGRMGVVRKFAGHNRRCIFVPDVEVDGPAQAQLANGSNGNGHAPDQATRAQRLVAIMRAALPMAPDGIPEDALFATAVAAGLPHDSVKGDLDGLLERGHAFRPVIGKVLPL